MTPVKKTNIETPKKAPRQSAPNAAGNKKAAPANSKPAKQSSSARAKSEQAPKSGRPGKVAPAKSSSKTPENSKSDAKVKGKTPATQKAAPAVSVPTRAAKSDKKAALKIVTPKTVQKPALPAKQDKKAKSAKAVAAKPSAQPKANTGTKSALPKPAHASHSSKNHAAARPSPNGIAPESGAEKSKASKKDILARILAMRADDTRKNARQAAAKAKPELKQRVPTSVFKAKESVESRKTEVIPVPEKASEKKTSAAAKRRKSPYSKTELRELRDILTAEKDRLLRDLQLMNEVASSSEENMSRSFSNHQADAATDSSALETTFMTRRLEEERLQMVLNSLRRLEEGTYGLCEMCDGDDPQKLCDTCPYIPVGRLRAKPFAKFCVQCRELLEKKSKR